MGIIKWEAQGALVKRLVEEGAPLTVICEQAGITTQTVYNWIEREGWIYNPSRAKLNTKTARQTVEVLELVDAGIKAGKVDIEWIAKQCSMGHNSVRRIIAKHRFEEWSALKSKVVTEKTCTRCLESKPLSAFPERSDREGKIHAICYECQIDWRQEYRHDNPTSIREASRRRRARLQGARQDGHKESEIISRDGGLCWFCKESVDLGLKHPDPMALSIHHIHPIAKYGPDIVKNVAVAHAICNRQAKDNYDPPFRSWSVAPIPSSLARQTVIEKHYLHRSPNVSFAYGVFDEERKLQGVITFGSSGSKRITQSVCDDPTKVIELNRLWIDDDAPFGLGSWFVSRALKQLPAYIVIAYADTGIRNSRYGTFHDGAIYRACSFNYGGSSAPSYEWRMPGKTRNVGRHTVGSVRVPLTSKCRFWTVVGTKADKRTLKRLCKWQVM